MDNTCSNVKYCPKCNSYQIKIVESIEVDDRVRRKRKCIECGHTYFTIEILISELNNLERNNRDIENYERMKELDKLLKEYYG